MNIRSFMWRDIFLLYSYRRKGLFLDSTRALIHGSAMIPMGALMPILGPTTRIYTYRCSHDSHPGVPLIGQVMYTKGASNARLSYMAPENEMDPQSVSAFSDFVASKMGEQGAFHILAEIDESSPVYHLLRKAGFAIYARQQIWRLDGVALGEAEAVPWRPCRPSDIIAARSLYCNLVPGLVQQVEPLPKKRLTGYVHYQKTDLIAFVELKYGRYGIWVQPYVHPDAQGFDRQLVYLLRNLQQRHDRPLYICIRSYQSWLESAVEALGAHPGPRQAVMVRHLTLAQRVKQTYPIQAIKNTHAEPTAPIAHIEELRVGEHPQMEKHPHTDSIS